MKPKPSALNLGRSPHKLGYRMPAEWELHEATWLSWPQDRETWPKELEEVEAAYLEIIKYLHEGEQIRILVHGKAEEGRVSKWLREKGIKSNVFFSRDSDRQSLDSGLRSNLRQQSNGLPGAH